MALPLLLAGCSPGMDAATQSIRQLLQPGGSAVPELDVKFAYLRVTRGRHVAYLWRGNTESSSDGVVEVYYSGSGEVVRLQNGRLVGALGLTTEWRRVAVAHPSWAAVASRNRDVQVERVRDVMPGYRTGVRDVLALRGTGPPERSALVGIDAKALVWFEESLQQPRRLFASTAEGRDRLPPTTYAVDLSGETELVVYSEQCLAADLCFSWQRWSKAMQSASAARAP
jgi:hypothetical protein